jgi:DNA-binding transcriptional ArsR family regulator
VDPQLLAALRALVDPQRLRIFVRLASRPADAEILATELRQPLPAIRRGVDVLVGAGLVEVRPGGPATPDRPDRSDRPARPDRSGPRTDPGPEVFVARPDRVGELARALAEMERAASGASETGSGGAWPHDGETLADTLARLHATAGETKILRSFLVDGRLASIPAQGRKRLVVLRFLVERVFTEAREYPEKEVNQRLAAFHTDVAALRRYLVDERLVDRAAGLYRRCDPRPEG